MKAPDGSACVLDFADYHAHERKKYRKCLINNSKVDFSMVPASGEACQTTGSYYPATVVDGYILGRGV